jgi:hypothetical protein
MLAFVTRVVDATLVVGSRALLKALWHEWIISREVKSSEFANREATNGKNISKDGAI